MKTIVTKSTILLFDLGGVLVEFTGPSDIQKLLKRRHSWSELRQKWSASQTVLDYETGAIGEAEFAERFVQEWDLKVGPREFVLEFRGWTRGFYPGARTLLSRLGANYRLACLSNSNHSHWQTNEHLHQVQQMFDAAYSSHQLGCHKPDARIYSAVLDRLGVEAGKVIFFDDIEANVVAAKAAGMQAHRVQGLEQLQRTLIELELL